MFALALHEPGVQLCRTILVGLSFSIVFSPQGMLYKGFQAPQNHLTTLTEEAGWNWVHNTQGGLLLPEDWSSSTLQKELDPGTSPLRYCTILAVQTITLTLFFFFFK